MVLSLAELLAWVVAGKTSVLKAIAQADIKKSGRFWCKGRAVVRTELAWIGVMAGFLGMEARADGASVF